MTCDHCGLFNPPTAIRCDCGFELNASDSVGERMRRFQIGRSRRYLPPTGVKELMVYVSSILLGTVALFPVVFLIGLWWTHDLSQSDEREGCGLSFLALFGASALLSFVLGSLVGLIATSVITTIRDRRLEQFVTER